MSRLDNVTVLGSGVLGGQIAWHSAFKGKTVTVYDTDPDAIVRCQAAHDQYAAIYVSDVGADEADIAAARERLTYGTDLAAAVARADLVIEAVPEIPAVKTAVYEELAGLLSADTLIATNSSTFLPRDFASATGRPEKFCALHFSNMIWAMNFAEIMAHPGTSPQTLTEVTEFAVEIGMLPIPVRKEQHGYVVNTWLVPFLNAAQTLVTNGVATPEDVDRTFLYTGARFGPLGMMDMIGMKTAYDVLSHWARENDDAQMGANAEYVKKNFLDRGRLGLQTGGGYYDYPDPAYQRPGFLDVPDISAVPDLVSLIVPIEGA
ncbi:3-hydroxyacyl-CoA dehydrogenase [Streptomyces griseorubiginosus]|uniref:3-hydroxyacyl-CoA dehydrogenase n=1 Tax=Streptomyces griseorubiginosus TaxID=67304 RepID=UPI00076CC858|nr:3-hydroxyacyl-CoA dehydrogenase [Streptomyces griseorubiginosus]KUM68120.1 3-hydroxybutyryl-CoA dehydrogenase [Streptomyces griseorubiginosus]